MKEQTSLRLEPVTRKRATELARLQKTETSSVMRQALRIGLEEYGKETALKLYAEEKLSLSEAAKLAGLSVGEMMGLLVK